jgi:hypothetical protein
MENEKVGEFSQKLVAALGIDVAIGTEIYVGQTNIAHMAIEHSYEYYRFFDKIPSIIANPDYVRHKQDDGSIEFIKSVGKHLKLAVRITGDGKYYARSLYFVHTKVVNRLIANGELKPLTKT